MHLLRGIDGPSDASSGRVRHDGRVARRAGWYVAPVLAGVLSALLAAGCGVAVPDSPPTGVDQLVIPTPSPDPRDFVPHVDNPWLALAPGTSRSYEVTGATTGRLTLTVRDDPVTVAGVVTTAVARTDPGGATTVDYFAQDRDGNVWWFGREGVWQAGEQDAEAGLAMPATPRRGDGWRAAYAPGVVDVRVSVATTDQTATTPAGRYDGLLGLDSDDPLTPGAATRSLYARGVGLVEEVSIDGPVVLVRLETAAD